MESLGQDVGMAKTTRLGASQRTHAFRHNAKKRLDSIRDQLHDPLLTVLTALLLFLLFVVVPLHASGIISAQGYGTLLVLLLASAVLVQSRTLLVIMVLLTAIGLAAAAAVFRFKLASSLHLYSRRGHASRLAYCSSLWLPAQCSLRGASPTIVSTAPSCFI